MAGRNDSDQCFQTRFRAVCEAKDAKQAGFPLALFIFGTSEFSVWFQLKGIALLKRNKKLGESLQHRID